MAKKMTDKVNLKRPLTREVLCAAEQFPMHENAVYQTSNQSIFDASTRC